MFRGACTATDDDEDISVPMKTEGVDVREHERRLLNHRNQLQNRQAEIRESLVELRANLQRTQLESEKDEIRRQCAILMESYEANDKVITGLVNSYKKFETTRTTLKTAELTHETSEAERALLDQTARKFKGKSTDQIIKDQVETERDLRSYVEMTSIMSQSETERQQLRYGIVSPSPVSIDDKLDAILGIKQEPVEIPYFPPVITTPPSASTTPYTSGVAASVVREFV